jgi:hypothetical protein
MTNSRIVFFFLLLAGTVACDRIHRPRIHPHAGDATGACLLEYNDALVSGDPCCYRQGEANRCNPGIACNEASGDGCCLIYGTQATSFGGRCCLYADGSPVDGAQECQQLLSAR